MEFVALALERTPVRQDSPEMVRDDVGGTSEPERREAGQHASLVGNRRREHDVEGGDAVARDEEQPVLVERVDLADLAAREVHGLRH